MMWNMDILWANKLMKKRVCMLCHFSCVRLCLTQGLQPAMLLCPWDSPGKNTRVGYHAPLLQGIFPTQESNPHLLYLTCFSRQILYPSTIWETIIKKNWWEIYSWGSCIFRLFFNGLYDLASNGLARNTMFGSLFLLAFEGPAPMLFRVECFFVDIWKLLIFSP